MHPNARWPVTAGPGRPPTRRSRWRIASCAVGVLSMLAALSVTGVGAAPSASAQSSSGVTWQADATSDLLAGFERTDFNEKGGPPEIANSPNLTGRQALRFTVDPGGQRSEVVPKIPHQREGDNLYFGYSGYLAQNFPVDADKYQIIMQWHHEGDEGSPPLAVHVKDNKLLLAGGDNRDHEAYEQPIAPATPNMPVNLVIRISFSQDPEKSAVDIWSQGRKVVSGFRPPDGTMYDDGDYLKVGMYRDTSLPETARVFVNNVAVGPDFTAVSQAVGTSSPAAPPGAAATTPEQQPSASSPTSSDSGLPVGTIATIALVLLAGAVAVIAILRRRQDDRSGRR